MSRPPAPPDAELTPLRWWQLPDVMELEAQLFAPEGWTHEMFWSELARPASRHYLGLRAGDVFAGYAGLAVHAGEAFVQTLGVRSGAQGRGFGTMLLEALLTEARRRGAATVGLEVRADNARAQLLYARNGFEVVGRRTAYYQPSGVDALLMLRDPA